MIYLASPYSGTKEQQDQRYEATWRFTVHHLLKGVPLFSPIVYGRNFEKQLGGAAKNWSVFNEAVLGRATALWVLQLPGWDTSLGVLAEIQMYQFLFPYALRFVEPL